MECERVRDEFVEYLTGQLAPERSRAIDEHIAGCPDCHRETDRLREMWHELGTLHVPTASGAHGRVERLVAARQSGSDARGEPAAGTAPQPTRPAPRRIAGGILALAAMLVIGIALGQRTHAPDVADTTVTMGASAAPERYILLLHGPARTASPTGALVAVDTAGEQAIVAEYRAWAMRLRDSGALVTAEKLADEPRTVLTAASATSAPSDAPDALGGYFLIQAADSAEAMRIARDCPHLKHGGTVEVRRIEPT